MSVPLSQVFEQLARHTRRRRDGLPTATLLVDVDGAAASVFHQWTSSLGQRLMSVGLSNPSMVLARILAELAARFDLHDLALHRLCSAADLPIPVMGIDRRLAASELEQLVAAATASADPHGSGRIARRLLSDGPAADLADLLPRLDAELLGILGAPGWRVFRALDDLLPPPLRPVIFLQSEDEDAPQASWLAGLAPTLYQFAETLPEWTVAASCSPDALMHYASEQPPSRSKSLLLMGVIRVSGRSIESAALLPGARPPSLSLGTPGEGWGEGYLTPAKDPHPDPLPEYRERGQEQGAATSLVNAGSSKIAPDASRALQEGAVSANVSEPVGAADILHALSAPPGVKDAFDVAAKLHPQHDEEARSAAERFLYELLQTHPRTAGCFVLNGAAGFNFGPRVAEVDLLAADLRLAVEVDGYYHFTDADAYRRDRRKDFQLQRHGYTIVRVLADDVVAQTQSVLDTVLAAVDHCRKPSTRETLGPDA